MNICVSGVNHHTAPVDVREKFSLAGGLVAPLLQAIREEKIFQEAVVLDTCNRTEVYYVPGERPDAFRHMLAHVARLKGTAPLQDTSALFRHEGPQAVEHLFRVAAGLDSQVIGEDEILGQVRTAYSLAVQARTARFLFNRLMHRALRVGKRVRTETELGQGSASVAQAAVELARHVFSNLEGRGVLLVGAGQTAELAARALLRSGAARLIVANRTLSRAQRLASDLLSAEGADEEAVRAACRLPGQPQPTRCPALAALAPECDLEDTEPAGPTALAIELAQIPAVIADVDLVISSTGAQGYVLRREDLADALRRRRRSLLIVDIAVPRDVDPALEELPDVYLYNIDDLDSLVADTLARRRLEAPNAEAIVRWEVEQFGQWFDGLQVVPTIRQLNERFRALQAEEIQRYGGKFSEKDRAELEKFTEALCRKILHRPMSLLRKLSGNNMSSDDLVAVDLIRNLFDLDMPEQEP
jgi:glutamyl-tRNA reductase